MIRARRFVGFISFTIKQILLNDKQEPQTLNVLFTSIRSNKKVGDSKNKVGIINFKVGIL